MPNLGAFSAIQITSWYKTCSRRYEVGDFSVLTRARTKNHLNVLEAVYISVLNPVLCKQKSFVTSLSDIVSAHTTHAPTIEVGRYMH